MAEAGESMDVEVAGMREMQQEKRTSLRVMERREKNQELHGKREMLKVVEKSEDVAGKIDRVTTTDEERRLSFLSKSKSVPIKTVHCQTLCSENSKQERKQEDVNVETAEASDDHFKTLQVQAQSVLLSSESSKQEETGADEQSALKRCEARIRRLDRLNEILEKLTEKSWIQTQTSNLLSDKLRSNAYFKIIQAKIKQRHRQWLMENQSLLYERCGNDKKENLNLSGKARNLNKDAEVELRQLRALEHQSVKTLRMMVSALSADTPVCEEEFKAAANVAMAAYNPAKQALSAAIDKAIESKGKACENEQGRCAQQEVKLSRNEDSSKTTKRGHLNPEAVCILEDWLVRNFNNPYPSEAEKANLVRLTGVSLKQINNWMSNARVRIWRPAVQILQE
ncbi:hypothetical protein GUITHDRAFT_163489 [Guillardia theta CCMP2712]|uniref:Homeobox domain-containing protein n=1 Tax=Guillardia theta (strain CCMP2712) TaxID=905079 RepID=L1J944_GUITC|nr:hypothetical protein GUITHDRAFT_163489 [Guillardia theta CCMP2712]EKX44595.1 hypothetical protein GUITHDRAFT_163489 [Guillardia theta CCMP2712]|eukprot:XP_005831575.1 hypothetical protein GUITHDRAFT_163489 [Guillardia theta CCMP2712]